MVGPHDVHTVVQKQAVEVPPHLGNLVHVLVLTGMQRNDKQVTRIILSQLCQFLSKGFSPIGIGSHIVKFFVVGKAIQNLCQCNKKHLPLAKFDELITKAPVPLWFDSCCIHAFSFPRLKESQGFLHSLVALVVGMVVCQGKHVKASVYGGLGVGRLHIEGRVALVGSSPMNRGLQIGKAEVIVLDDFLNVSVNHTVVIHRKIRCVGHDVATKGQYQAAGSRSFNDRFI